MTILTAEIANVHFPVEGGLIEGLMDENGEFYVGVPQFCRMFSLATTHASRDFKRWLGKDGTKISLTPLKTPLNSKPVNALPIQYLQDLIYELAIRGNKAAINCGRALMKLSIIQLFKDAFNIKMDKDDRAALMEAWYPVREKSIFAHAGFCEAIKRRRYQGNRVHSERSGEGDRREHDYMTLIIFGDTAQAARLKAIVSEELDASIGLNHQEDVVKLDQLATAKLKFATLKRKGESWESQVERACAMAIKLVPNLV